MELGSHKCIASEYKTTNSETKKFKHFYKMLKDVGMTVRKSRETSAVYMQQDRR